MNGNKYEPTEIHCKRCKTLMEKGVCPNCGFKIYVPMDETKQKRIRLILGGVLLVAFALIVLFTKVI